MSRRRTVKPLPQHGSPRFDSKLVSHRVRAILAGGLVLGVGAVMTLASWNDSEFIKGTFTASGFSIEGSLDGTVYSDHSPIGNAAILVFTAPATALSPGDIVYAPYAVRLDSTSTSNGTVTVTSAATSGVVAGLTYSLVKTSTFSCNQSSAAAGVVVIPAGTAVGVVPASTTFPVAMGAGSDAGAPEELCLVVTAGETLTQLQTGTATFEFAAVSN
jgi:predicted ribosomally synthesized peptide with SipW-like signal peptide